VLCVPYHGGMREFAVIMAVIAAVSAIAQCQPRRLVLKPTEPMPTVLITSCRSAKAILPKPSGGVLGYGMPLDEIIHSGPNMNRRPATSAIERARAIFHGSPFLSRLINRQAMRT
jgi:hypothetical protein